MLYKIITANITVELYKKCEEYSAFEERSKNFFIKKGLEKIFQDRKIQAQKAASKLLKELGFDE